MEPVWVETSLDAIIEHALEDALIEHAIDGSLVEKEIIYFCLKMHWVGVQPMLRC